MLPPTHTRANGPARTSLQTAGLCEPTTGQARWQGPSLLASTFLLKWSHRHLWLPQPPGLVSLFEVMLYCTLEALPSPSPTRRFSSGRPWKADGSTGATTTRTGRMQRGEGGLLLLPTRRPENSSGHQPEKRGAITPGGWVPRRESGDPGFWKSLRDFGQISKHFWACSFSCELEGSDSDVQIVLKFYPPMFTQKG